MRLGVVFVSMGLIIGGFFTLMGLAYGAGGALEDLGVSRWGIHGLSMISNIVILMLVIVMVFATLLTLA